jgi:2-polyprenyl-3-methyl-5-hydroxy-6-metoxy-1,4-benzoquinol methylase
MMKVGKIVSLTQRRLQPEIMDRPDLDPARHWHALRGLARINWLSSSAGILWPPIRQLAKETVGRPLRILDVACGGGDVSIGLCRRATQAGLAVQIEAADISPNALTYARQRAEAAHAPIRFFQIDALADDFQDNYDVVFSSLFLHHLNDEQAVNLLQRMAHAARHMVLINDLARSRLAWTAAYVATRMLTTSEVVHTDGPLSVEGAFTPDEALALAQQAGLREVTITRRWPFRFLLTWTRA